MKKDEVKELLKKCFGKQKNDRYHAIAMLIIYFIFISIVVSVIRISDTTLDYKNSNENDEYEVPIIDNNIGIENEGNNKKYQNNYSYSYNILYNGVSEVYLGKKNNDKEKFTLVKDGINTNYAILNDNFLVMENNIYHIAEKPSHLFKYCDVEKLLMVVENEISMESNNIIKYNVSNKKISMFYKDNIIEDNNLDNTIQLTKENDIVKIVDIDFSNYISSINNETSTLNIHMEFVDIGTTEDFEIKVN